MVHRYRSDDEDSGRWDGFDLRAGDVVISSRSKSGTTWIQMICALLAFQTDELPAPLARLSPWMDWLGAPTAEVHAALAAQVHRRFIKTHTPLDGIPIEPQVRYLVVARHPLDAAVSLHHQGANLDRERMAELTGAAPPASTVDRPAVGSRAVGEWLARWIEHDADPRAELDSLPGVFHHLADAWGRRRQPNVLLVHYDDLLDDLEGQMRRIARFLEIAVEDETWPDLVAAAGFEAMRARADDVAPDPDRILRDRSRFFRRGSSGEGRAVLTDEQWTRYLARVEELADRDLLAWLHRDGAFD